MTTFVLCLPIRYFARDSIVVTILKLTMSALCCCHSYSFYYADIYCIFLYVMKSAAAAVLKYFTGLTFEVLISSELLGNRLSKQKRDKALDSVSLGSRLSGLGLFLHSTV